MLNRAPHALIFAPLVLALAACATPVPRFDPLPDTQRLPVEYRADAVAGAWSPEDVQPTDAAGSQEELAVTEQVMVECRVLTVPDDLVDAWSRDERAVFALEVPSGAAEPLYDAEGVESLTAPRIVLNSGARGAIATHDQHAFVEAFHVVATDEALVADPVVAIASGGFHMGLRATAVGEQVELEVFGEFADVQGLDAPREVQLPVGAPVHIQQPVTLVQRVAVSATLEVYRQVVVRLPGQAPGESMLLIVEPRVVSESP